MVKSNIYNEFLMELIITAEIIDALNLTNRINTFHFHF